MISFDRTDRSGTSCLRLQFPGPDVVAVITRTFVRVSADRHRRAPNSRSGRTRNSVI